jgi:hypothetical protein
MTKRMAIFVEGQTEQIFVERLIKEIANEKNVHLESRSLSDDKIISLETIPSGVKPFQVTLFNCENDEKVKSVILEVRPKLITRGYSLIIGLRDLHPNTVANLNEVKMRLAYRVPTSPPATEIYLAVAETEAWFIQEKEHYAKIDPSLDYRQFKSKFGFDPENDSAEQILHPYKFLKSIYRSVGKAYKKKRFHVQRTVDALDFAELCFSCGVRIPHFEALSNRLQGFFV